MKTLQVKRYAERQRLVNPTTEGLTELSSLQLIIHSYTWAESTVQKMVIGKMLVFNILGKKIIPNQVLKQEGITGTVQFGSLSI